MRQRITFLHKPGGAVDPALIKITDESLTGPEILASREVRVTLALDELPEELARVLRRSHELHLRWVSPDIFETVSPLLSRLPPGLHLFYTPQRPEDLQSEALCALLRRAFGSLDCTTPKDSFVSLANDRFSHSAAFQFYQPLDNIGRAVQFVRDELCPEGDALCRAQVERAAGAGPVSLDISYDTISHALKVTALSPFQAQSLVVTSHPGGHRTEVGILGEDVPPTLEPHELGLSGHLVVLGQHKAPSVTMFSFPSRHRRHAVDNKDSTFSASFTETTGLHPTLRLRLSSRKPPPAPADGQKAARCTPHAYFTLPRAIFADKYQLSDPLFLASKNLTALRYGSSNVDLEAPEYAVQLWGSSVLLELSPPPLSSSPPSGDGDDASDEPWTAEIPLHLRYLKPAVGGYSTIDVPYPAVFWACNAEEGTKFPNNPFERANLGFDGLFGPRTVFWHVDPRPEPAAGTRLLNRVDVPVLDLDKSHRVGAVTTAVVILGFVWVVWKLVIVVLAPSPAPSLSSSAKNPESKKTR